MTTLDWVVGVFVTAAAWAALYRGLERAAPRAREKLSRVGKFPPFWSAGGTGIETISQSPQFGVRKTAVEAAANECDRERARDIAFLSGERWP